MHALGTKAPRASIATIALATLLGGCTATVGGDADDSDNPGGGARAGKSGSGGSAGRSSGSGGSTGNGGSGGPVECNDAAAAPIRRLSRVEYLATLRDLFPGVDVGAPTLAPDPSVVGFENRANKLYATENNVGDFNRAAVGIATKAVADLTKVVPCTATDAACGAKFIEEFGQRAFRRPLSTDEKTRYAKFFETQRTGIGFKEAVQLTLEAMLQSVHFLYRMDLDDAGDAGNNRRKLNGWQLASRLSYLLWGTMPDAALFQAAKDGKLATDAEIKAQADRMLKDGKARGQLVDFHRQWLDYNHVIDVHMAEGDKDTTRYPGYTADLRAAMREESDRFTARVMADGSHSLGELLTSRETFVNGPLADLYGVSKPASGWQKTTLPDGKRAGLLTQGSFLASRAHKLSGSPPLRAVFIQRRLLCLPEQVPDADADTSEPKQMMGEAPKTNRQLFEARVAARASCKGCHVSIDGIGFTFENYDAIGSYRDTDNGLPVDPSGQLLQSDVDGPVKNAVELSSKLASSGQVQACMARQWLGFATGIDVGDDDCRVARFASVLESSKGDVHALLLELVKSRDFMTRPAQP